MVERASGAAHRAVDELADPSNIEPSTKATPAGRSTNPTLKTRIAADTTTTPVPSHIRGVSDLSAANNARRDPAVGNSRTY